MLNKNYLMAKYAIIILILSISKNVFADIIINKDTTINNVWEVPPTTIIRFETGGHVHGTGSINGGIIDAAYNQWIFDSSITVNPTALYGGNFSARWYGADPTKKDNWYQLQTAINTCMNRFPLYIPPGSYDYYTSLFIQQIYNGSFVGCYLHMFGEANFWSYEHGSILNFKGGNSSAIAIMIGKGVEINNITIQGQWRSPNTPDSVYFNTALADYTDQSGLGLDTRNRGITIDNTTNNGNVGGSTGLYIHDLCIRNFCICITGSLNGQTLNNDILRVSHVQFGDCKIGFQSTQGQEKGNVLEFISEWGSCHTLFSSGNELNGQGGNYTINYLNIAGRVIRLFYINNKYWGQITISNGFFEQVGEIGVLNSGQGMSISNCTFDFAYPQQVGSKILLTTNSENVIAFHDCYFRYFGQNDTLHMLGRASFINCFFTGKLKDSLGVNTVTYPLPGTPGQSGVKVSAK